MKILIQVQSNHGRKYFIQNILLFLLIILPFLNLLFAQGWGTELELRSNNLYTGDRFGTSVDLDGFHAIIGAPGEDEPGGNPDNGGAVHFFSYKMIIIRMAV